jgi:hypothetical protein
VSTPWGPDYIVHVDRKHDAENASNGYSRYGSYVGAREPSFQDPWEQPEKKPLEPIAFAIQAWQVATVEVSSPSLVEFRPDINKITLGYDEDGDRLVVTVELPLRHRDLAAKIPYTYDDWGTYHHWSSDDYAYLQQPRVRPDRPVVTTVATIRHIPQITLVTPGKPTGRALVDDALHSVELTAAAINASLPEIIRTVQGGDR